MAAKTPTSCKRPQPEEEQQQSSTPGASSATTLVTATSLDPTPNNSASKAPKLGPMLLRIVAAQGKKQPEPL